MTWPGQLPGNSIFFPLSNVNYSFKNIFILPCPVMGWSWIWGKRKGRERGREGGGGEWDKREGRRAQSFHFILVNWILCCTTENEVTKGRERECLSSLPSWPPPSSLAFCCLVSALRRLSPKSPILSLLGICLLSYTTLIHVFLKSFRLQFEIL